MNETIERVIMNKQNGEIGIAIRLSFTDKHHSENLGSMDGYSIVLLKQKPEALAIFSGHNDAAGPWMLLTDETVIDQIEDLGPL